jgi:Tol biopolymer transport system component
MPAPLRLALTLFLLALAGGGRWLAGAPATGATAPGGARPAAVLAPYKLSTGGFTQGLQISPDGSRVVFMETDTSGHEQLYSVPVAGGTPTRLNGPLINNLGTYYRISPDSSRVIYTARQDVADQLALYSVPLAGGTPVLLSAGMVPGEWVSDAFEFEESGPPISPDSSRVVYVVRRAGVQQPEADLYSVPLRGGSPVRLSTMQGPGDSIFDVRISSDSSRVIFLAGGYSAPALYSVPITGGAPIRLSPTPPPGWSTSGFRVSPDGRMAVYNTGDYHSFARVLYSVPTGGGTPTLLDELDLGSYAITPDGSRLIYSGMRRGAPTWELFSVPLAGGSVTALDDDVTGTPLQITPDAGTVVYTGAGDGGAGRALYSVPVAGGAPRRLSGPLTAGGEVSDGWSTVSPAFRISPDGRYAVYRADQEVDEQFELYSVPLAGGAPVKLNAPLPPGGDVGSSQSYPSAFLISPDSQTVVYPADQEVDDRFELYRVPIGGGAAGRISGPMVAGGGIVRFELTPDSARAVYLADQEVYGRTELYASGLEGVGGPATPTPGGPATPTPGGPATPTPGGPSPTPAPVPGNDERPTPGRPAQSRAAGPITVYAERFDGAAGDWTATGTVWIGPYVIVEAAEVRFARGALSGAGLVSMVSAPDGGRRTALFSGPFELTGERVAPRAAGFAPRLNNLAGFRLLPDGLQLWVDAARGLLHGAGGLQIVAPGNVVTGAAEFQLGHAGALTGEVSDATLQLGAVRLKILSGALGSEGLSIRRSELQVGPGLGGARAEIQTTVAQITRDGRFVPAAVFPLPNLRVGGASGFAIEGIKVDLTVQGDVYRFAGAGTFVLPGVGVPAPGKDGERGVCKLGVRFALASRPPPIRNAGLTLDGCARIPLGSTGFFITRVSGDVTLDENAVAVDIGLGIEGGPDIPGLGATVSGEPSAHWDSSWKVALKGDMKVFSFDAAEAALTLSKARGLEGELRIQLAGGLLDGEGNLRVWRDSSGFHVTGRQQVVVQLEKGEIFERCAVGVCVSVPLSTYRGPSVGADFGEFRVGDTSVYGVKGRVELLGYQAAFFVDAGGQLRVGRLDEYRLAGALTAGQRPQAGTDQRAFDVAPGTPALLVELAAASGAPALSLTTPDGRTLGAGSPGVTASATLTQTLLAVADPQPGRWQATASGLDGGEYLLAALGARPGAAVAPPTVTPNADGSYTIGLIASSAAPTSTISLFVDSSPDARAGQPIARGLPLTTTAYTWRPGALAAGDYYLYAMVDDPLGAPAFAYAAAPIAYRDATAPATPAGLGVAATGAGAAISWRPGAEPDLAGYRVYYTEPGGGATFVADIPDGARDSYVQEGLYLNGAWEVRIAAYDLSGNESPRSPAQAATVRLSRVYLPLARR